MMAIKLYNQTQEAFHPQEKLHVLPIQTQYPQIALNLEKSISQPIYNSHPSPLKRFLLLKNQEQSFLKKQEDPLQQHCNSAKITNQDTLDDTFELSGELCKTPQLKLISQFCQKTDTTSPASASISQRRKVSLQLALSRCSKPDTSIKKCSNLQKFHFIEEKSPKEEEFNQFHNKYQQLEVLGKGQQGVVYKTMEKSTKKIYATKIFTNYDEELKMTITNEFSMLKNVVHPNILQVHELLEDKRQNEMYLVMEYFEGESLNLIEHSTLTIELKVQMLYQLLQILQHIHSMKIIHRDIKLSNIMYCENTGQIKLIDFGVAKKQQSDELNFSAYGNRHYQAPEMIQGDQYNEKVDIWQIGQFFYEISQNMLIPSKNLIKQIKQKKLYFNDNISDEIKDIILQLLSINQETRPTAEQALEHQVFKKYNLTN